MRVLNWLVGSVDLGSVSGVYRLLSWANLVSVLNRLVEVSGVCRLLSLANLVTVLNRLLDVSGVYKLLFLANLVTILNRLVDTLKFFVRLAHGRTRTLLLGLRISIISVQSLFTYPGFPLTGFLLLLLHFTVVS
jgi:hypothetical protein